jgi:hypothetical protein
LNYQFFQFEIPRKDEQLPENERRGIVHHTGPCETHGWQTYSFDEIFETVAPYASEASWRRIMAAYRQLVCEQHQRELYEQVSNEEHYDHVHWTLPTYPASTENSPVGSAIKDLPTEDEFCWRCNNYLVSENSSAGLCNHCQRFLRNDKAVSEAIAGFDRDARLDLELYHS